MKPLIRFIGLSPDNKSLFIIPTKEGITEYKKDSRLKETIITIAKQDVMAFMLSSNLAAKFVKIEYRMFEDRLTISFWMENETRDGIILPLFLHDNPTTDGKVTK